MPKLTVSANELAPKALHCPPDRQRVIVSLFSWIVWPSKEARMAAWDKVMADPRMQPDKNPMPFDGKRMIYGSFEPIVEQ